MATKDRITEKQIWDIVWGTSIVETESILQRDWINSPAYVSLSMASYFNVLFSPTLHAEDHLSFETLPVKGSWPISLSLPWSLCAVGEGVHLFTAAAERWESP